MTNLPNEDVSLQGISERCLGPTEIATSVKERHLALVGGHGQVEAVSSLSVVADHGKQVGHEEAGQHKGGGNSTAADVLLNLGLSIEVVDVRQTPAADLAHVDEGGEDEVLDAGRLASVGDSLALGYFAVSGRVLPVVGDHEDGVSAGDGGGGQLNGSHIGLAGNS